MQSAIVNIRDVEFLKSRRKAIINLSVSDDTTFRVRDKVKDSGPLGIDTTFVE